MGGAEKEREREREREDVFRAVCEWTVGSSQDLGLDEWKRRQRCEETCLVLRLFGVNAGLCMGSRSCSLLSAKQTTKASWPTFLSTATTNCSQSFDQAAAILSPAQMTSHLKNENKLQGCFSQELFDPLEKCLGKNPYCSSEIIFDNGCIGDGVSGSPEKELMVDSQARVMESLTSAPGTCEAKFSNPGSFSFVLHEEKPPANSTARKKRKRPAVDPRSEETDEFKSQLFSILETSSQVLTAHVEAQSVNSQLDRNQRKEHAESLVGVLGKLTDALGKIAERL